MSRRLGSVTLAAAAVLGFAAPAMAADDALNAYRVKPTADNKKELAAAGYDLAEGDRGRYIEIYATRSQARALKSDGVAAKQVTAFRAAAAPEDYTGDDSEFDVWTRYDAVPADGKEQYVEQYQRIADDFGADDEFDIAKLESLGKTHLGRDIWAVKITKDASTTADGTRPAVFYNAQQHAREWLAGETCRRTLEYVADNYGTDERITELVDTRELWFSCISNPDGFEYTFTDGNRLWRKNMADNDGDGTLGEPGDGVDPNRNFATNWGRDNEGSSSDPASETYRGTGPDSEPETKAMKGLWARVDFAFQKNDHTAAELLLYPQGFQLYTPTPDNGIFEALAGDDFEPAIADKRYDEGEPEEGDEAWVIEDSPLDADTSENRFDPDISAELYITNGDALDDAYHEAGILGFTPEGSEPLDENASGFVFQDDEEDVQAEFERHLQFALDLADSAADPANPVSHMGNATSDFYVDTFKESYGDPQP
ncbi:MAG: M14 family metallopeptidase, partial [Solirubrobacteraceae bacterium]